MDAIEFLKHTDHRNLKNQIDYLVKRKFREREEELNERRRRKLKQQLDEESQQLELELSDLLRSRLEEKQADRLNWIGLKRLERERADEELLRLTKMQQHLENAEEVRHIYSREMLLHSKQAQLYQIAEKIALRAKQAEGERLWLDAMESYEQQKEKRQIVGQKLRKVVADVQERKNLQQDDEKRSKAREEAKALREELNRDNIRAWNMEKKLKKDEDFYEWRKKVHHRDVLERQILQNALKEDIQRQNEKITAKAEAEQIQRSILMSLDCEGAQTIKNRHRQEEYLKYSQNVKESVREQEKALEDAFTGTGCVLEQKEKRPYGKNTR